MAFGKGHSIGFGGSESFPFLATYPALAKDAQKQALANILRVRIRDPQFSATSPHVLVIAAGYRRVKAQSAEIGNQLSPFDRTKGRHSGDFTDFDAIAINLRNRGVIGDAEEQPSFQHAL